jgi:hypothetical protein
VLKALEVSCYKREESAILAVVNIEKLTGIYI